MIPLSRLLRTAFWSSAGKLAQVFLNLGTLALVARVVGPEALGTVSLAWVAVGLAELIVSGALTDSLVQRSELRRQHTDTIFWTSVLFSVVACGALVAAPSPIATLLGGGAALAAILPLRAASIPLAAVGSVPRALMQREARFGLLAGLDTGAAVASAVLGVCLAISGFGIWSLVAMEVARTGIVSVGVFVFGRWRPGFALGARAFVELLSFNSSTVLGYCVYFADRTLPRLVIGRFLGPEAVGFYAVGERLYDQLEKVLIGPAREVAMTGAARAQHDPAELRKLLVGAIQTSALVVLPACLGLVAIAGEIVPWVFGPSWAGAILTVQLLLLRGVRAPIAAFIGSVLRGIGKPHLNVLLLAVGTAIVAVLAPLATPWGVAGVAFAVLMRSILVWPLGAWLAARSSGLSAGDQFRAGTGPLVASGLMAVLVWTAQQSATDTVPSSVLVLACVALGAISYPLLLKSLAPDSFAALARLLRSLRRHGSRTPSTPLTH